MEGILQKKGLKRTKLREALLQCLVQAKHAQSYLDIKRQLSVNVDKSTLYRNLSVFEELGLIHRIVDYSGAAKYAFGSIKNHGGNHAHFVCEQCETVYCVENAPVEDVLVPKGFKTKQVQTMIRGTCDKC